MIRYIKYLKIVIGVIIALHSLTFASLIFQEQLIFRSDAVSKDHKLKILLPHQEYFWEDTDSLGNYRRIHNVIFQPREKTERYVFFLHGASKNIEYHTQYASHFVNLGSTVWAMDYVGFGKSRGNRTENLLYEDAFQMLRQFAQQYDVPIEEIIIVGKDLGAGMATQVAQRVSSKKLVLISPFSNLIKLHNDYVFWFPFRLFINYEFPNDHHLKNFSGQIGIFFGSTDMFIPYRNARRLQAILKPGDEFHEYSKKSSVDVMYEPSFQEDLKLFLKK